MRVVVAVAATLIALLSGCSSERPDTATEPTATTTAAPTTGTTAPTTTAPSTGEPVDAAAYHLADTPTGTPGYYFRTPSGNFRCAIFDEPLALADTAVEAGCQGRVAAVPDGEQPCAESSGAQPPMPAFGLSLDGPRFACTTEGLFYGPGDIAALPYDSYLEIGNVRCLSREVGITCEQRSSGASFFVSKESSRLESSGGADATLVAVPDVRGERPIRAENLLAEAGLLAKVVGGTDRGPHDGQCVVAEQDPAAGTKVTAGTLITLTTGEVGFGAGSC
ncbi:PASTA domain-containing protein [Nocardia otitidiscaviarum]|nr:PASTA domain-containing protein [Nocardia otitidiscaviarum]MCP9623124.1 PASTA domain-containing protein [Nocardia otitidiscaviarum]